MAAPTLDPLSGSAAWREEARTSGALEPDAMTLATATAAGAPSARVVLCRGVDQRGIRFFTNCESRKGVELAQNALAAAVFYWPSLNKQVRLEGRVEKVGGEESDAYFAERPRWHQLQAWASAQSQPIASLAQVQARHAELDAQYQGDAVPRPPNWGGYRLRPERVELWIRGEARMHERRLFFRDGPGWRLEILSP